MRRLITDIQRSTDKIQIQPRVIRELALIFLPILHLTAQRCCCHPHSTHQVRISSKAELMGFVSASFFNEYLLRACMDWFYISSSHRPCPHHATFWSKPGKEWKVLLWRPSEKQCRDPGEHLKAVPRCIEALLWGQKNGGLTSQCLANVISYLLHVLIFVFSQWLIPKVMFGSLSSQSQQEGLIVGWLWTWIKCIPEEREQMGYVSSRWMISRGLPRARSQVLVGFSQSLAWPFIRQQCDLGQVMSTPWVSALSSSGWG